MKCPHCGNEISEFAISCPNCGGNPKGQATEEVKSKARSVVKKRNSLNNRLSLIGAAIALSVVIIAPFFFTRIVYLGLNRIVECILYLFVAVVVIVIGCRCNSFKIVSKNVTFYIISVVIAVADFILQNVYYKYLFGSEVINLMKEKMKPVWTMFNVAKIFHIIILILGISLVFNAIKQKESKQ